MTAKNMAPEEIGGADDDDRLKVSWLVVVVMTGKCQCEPKHRTQKREERKQQQMQTRDSHVSFGKTDTLLVGQSQTA